MTEACPRSFEVEALRDGRLDGDARERFRAHLASCPACAREARALEALAEALRSDDGSAADELRVRRERTRLLAAFDSGLAATRPPPRRAPWRPLAAGVAVLTSLAAAAFLLLRPDASPAVVSVPARVEPVTVRADADARWSRRRDGQREIISLQQGALFVRVEHAGSQPDVLVVLPDGELEDLGTTFSVSADAGHTTRVTVQEGSVVLRLRGTHPVVIGAGEAWAPSPAAAAPSARPSPPPRAIPSAKPSTQAAASASSTVRARGAEAGAEFRAAMSAFDVGNSAQAAALFASFLERHPTDPRAEDAAYLRALAFRRIGDTPATRRAAHEYLARFPSGFRRAEAEALTR